MKKIILDNIEYELIEDNGDCFSESEIKEKYTDYFQEFDYILGDYAYNKLRLKGFCDKGNKLFKVISLLFISSKFSQFCFSFPVIKI